VVGIGLTLLLSVWAVFLQRRPQPLRADAQTLYLVNSSQDLNFSSLPSQWHWQELRLPGAAIVVSPYHPTGDALEIDAQISDSGASINSDDFFGIVVGLDNQGAGYACGVTLNQPIVSYSGWDAHTIQRETTSGVYSDFSHYVTITVTIQQHVITLLYDGKQVAQATVTASPTGGLIGLFSSPSTSATVQGFRIDYLS
jgi:hypothetical protein